MGPMGGYGVMALWGHLTHGAYGGVMGSHHPWRPFQRVMGSWLYGFTSPMGGLWGGYGVTSPLGALLGGYGVTSPMGALLGGCGVISPMGGLWGVMGSWLFGFTSPIGPPLCPLCPPSTHRSPSIPPPHHP